MLLYYSQTVSAIATATCDLRAVALLRCAVALLLFVAITSPPTSPPYPPLPPPTPPPTSYPPLPPPYTPPTPPNPPPYLQGRGGRLRAIYEIDVACLYASGPSFASDLGDKLRSPKSLLCCLLLTRIK